MTHCQGGNAVTNINQRNGQALLKPLQIQEYCCSAVYFVESWVWWDGQNKTAETLIGVKARNKQKNEIC